MKKNIYKIILGLILLLFVIILCGCTRQEPISNTLADNAISAATVLEKQLPKECITEAVATQITVIKTEIRAVKSACQAEKDDITRDKLKWKLSFWALVGVVLAYILHKVLK